VTILKIFSPEQIGEKKLRLGLQIRAT
jgi:hypothetical protein